ncbi:hypothetical protein JCM8547_006302 [Rhodosporidiobolus lusitaniae]
MDFLTQPFHPPAKQPTSPSLPAHSPGEASTSSSSPATPTDKARYSPTETPSTTHSAAHQLHVDRFSAVRTASPTTKAAGLPGEEKVDYPSEQKGDWKAFGRVAAMVVVWEEGTVGEGEKEAEKRLREEQGLGEWVVEGQLWVTKDNHLLLILDRDFPPLSIDRSNVHLTRTISGNFLTRRLSLGGGSGTGGSPVRTRRSSTSSTGGNGGESAEEGPTSPVMGFLKKMVAAVSIGGKKSSTGEGGEEGSGKDLTRTRSIELGKRRASEQREAKLLQDEASAVGGEGRKSKEKEREEREEGGEEGEGVGGGTIRFEECRIERVKGPLPEYKGYPITALSIASLSTSFTSLRFYPHRSSSDPPLHPGSEPISEFAIPPHVASELFGSATLFEGTEVHPPVVEMDVRMAGGREGEQLVEGAKGQREGNRGREVTVGFVFKELLLAQEATTFHTRLSSLLPASQPRPSSPLARTISGNATSGGGGSGFGATLLRTLSGGGGSSSKEPAPSSPPPTSAGKQGRRRSSFMGFGFSDGEGHEPTN